MEQVFKSLLRSKEKPTNPTFNSMITNYGKARLRDKAEGIFQKMTDMGYKPSYITYECLIMTYGRCDSVSRARDIFDEMVETEKEKKVSTLNSMLDVYCMNGLTMEAQMLFESIHHSKIFPIDSSTYKLLYKAYTKADMKGLVEKLLKYMDGDGIIPNKRFFLDALGAFGSSPSSQKSTDLMSRGSFGRRTTVAAVLGEEKRCPLVIEAVLAVNGEWSDVAFSFIIFNQHFIAIACYGCYYLIFYTLTMTSRHLPLPPLLWSSLPVVHRHTLAGGIAAAASLLILFALCFRKISIKATGYYSVRFRFHSSLPFLLLCPPPCHLKVLLLSLPWSRRLWLSLKIPGSKYDVPAAKVMDDNHAIFTDRE
nr:pentatricopeptide repeat-containing protein At4g39620, chloroplastic [Ipomoea batatas]